jgi:hypothetical protein
MPSEKLDVGPQTLWLDDEGIFHVDHQPASELTLADAKGCVRALGAIAGGVKRPPLVDMRNIRSIERPARQHFAGPETASVQSAAALLVGSPITRAMGNFFLGLNKPVFPTRLFHDQSEAMAWLRTHRS